jgi:hypothetical protein
MGCELAPRIAKATIGQKGKLLMVLGAPRERRNIG